MRRCDEPPAAARAAAAGTAARVEDDPAMTPELIRMIYASASMQRWNDYPRMVELVELDKQAHKFIIAWFLAKREAAPGFNFLHMIEAGIFEFLRRVIVTDIRPDVFRHVLMEKEAALNAWVMAQLRASIGDVQDGAFLARLTRYFSDEAFYGPERELLKAAHYLATRWEFQIVYQSSMFLSGAEKLKKNVEREIVRYLHYKGVVDIMADLGLAQIMDLNGRLRFQLRWAQTPRIPKTSVLGHVLVVALCAYFYCLHVGACAGRTVAGFFSALFHDLPEALTRDIISPVKQSVEGLDDVINEYEINMITRDILPLVPEDFRAEFSYLLGLYEEGGELRKAEFKDRILDGGRVRHVDDFARYNEDRYQAVDGRALKACDHLAAFTEAAMSIALGVQSAELKRGAAKIKAQYRDAPVGGCDFHGILCAAEAFFAGSME